MKARGNYSALETKEIIEEVEARYLAIEELSSTYLRSGSDWWNSGSDKIGGGFVEIAPPSERSITGLEVVDLIQKSTEDIPGIKVDIEAD